MFTGIITSTGIIESAEQRGDLHLRIACDLDPESLHIGESIACNGACLTVVTKGLLTSGKPYFTVTLSPETITCTSPRWKVGDRINLERSLCLGDRLDGHMVSGHIDGIAIISSITPSGDSHILEIKAPAELSRFIAEKGSVTLDGVSLTVNKVEDNYFLVNIIPHTRGMTTLGERKPGDALNLEIDLIARYIARLLQK